MFMEPADQPKRGTRQEGIHRLRPAVSTLLIEPSSKYRWAVCARMRCTHVVVPRTTDTWYSRTVQRASVIETINHLLDNRGPETSNTSMRIPTALRDAAALAVRELGVAPSATALTAAALRATLEAAVMQAALDDHYERHPDARPSLGDLAVAAAELDGHPLAEEPERIHQAASEIVERHPDASPEDVVLWAEARALPAA